ncbi:glycosyltransferase [Paenibacillus sp. GCM10027627]|uniref:glycosyltransferase n=1 Tax=unclassified Paenibacillus TaxID=185978 RepID=UPI0036286277
MSLTPASERISLCMIVKNEAKGIAACLESAKRVVDEIIVVDTGSTDDTVSICQSYGATVLTMEWNENFAEARNFGLQYATGNWILWLDADEVLDRETAPLLRQILTERDTDIAVVELINYIGEEPASESRSYLVRHHRVFRNHIGFRFNGAIHEQLNVEEILGTSFNLHTLPVKVHHYGYMDDYVQSRNKAERNQLLLENERKKEDYSPWVDYHLASEYYRLGQYERAYHLVNIAIKSFIDLGKLPPSLCYKLKYDAVISNGAYDGGWPSIERAIQLYPDYVDLHYYKGIILYHKQKYSLALETFQHCLELGEENLQHLTLRGAGSFHAHYFIGLCHEGLKHHEAAKEAYRSCLEQDAAHPEAAAALSRLLQLEQNKIAISLCMIVRNEEDSLPRCLDSVKALVDEIVIVDTGSVDRTKEIATAYNARIYDFVWIDDFAAARNFAFSKATKEYILWLDADDVLDDKAHAAFNQLKSELSVEVQSVTMPYILTTTESGEPLFTMRRNRLVRRDAGFQWIGPVHEYLAVAGQLYHSDIGIYHKKEKQHTDRNLNIYENRLAAGETFSPRDLYYFANELKDHSRYEEALLYYERFLDTGEGWSEDNVQACLKIEQCLVKLNREEERLPVLLRSFDFDKPHSDICCQIGEIWLDRHRLHQAVFWFELATQLEIPSDQLTMTQASTWTWVPHLKLAVCYDQLNDKEKACYHNEIALGFLPDHPSMLFNRAYFKESLGDRFEFTKAKVAGIIP